MTCLHCYDLEPTGYKSQQHGHVTVLFVPAAELRVSDCPSCKLVWNALVLYKSQWEEADLHQSVELRVGYRMPLKINWRPDAIYLDVFTRKGKGDLFLTICIEPLRSLNFLVLPGSAWMTLGFTGKIVPI